MIGKKILKKIVFGNLINLPFEIEENMINYDKPQSLNPNKPDKEFKVIFCEAKLKI